MGLSRRRSVSVSVCLSNINISKTSVPIAIKFYLKHDCGRGKVALGFGPDRIRTLVSMATNGTFLCNTAWILICG